MIATWNHDRLRLVAVMVWVFLCACAGGEEPAPEDTSPPTPVDETGVLDVGAEDTSPPTPADETVVLDVGAEGSTFGDLFRSVNLDAGKQMAEEADYDRILRLMCPDPSDCVPGPVRYWDKVRYGRYALEAQITRHEVLASLHERAFPVMWTLIGTPAFLSPSCSGCTVTAAAETYHLLRPLTASADHPENPTGLDLDCSCTDDDWAYDPPSTKASEGVGWLDYLSMTVTDGLSLFAGDDAHLRIALWNEPDTGHWSASQTKFVSMWCASLDAMRQGVGDRDDVLLGGPDVSSWAHSIGDATTPLLEELQSSCGGEGAFDFLTYHNYSEPGHFLLEESVNTVRSWADDPDLIVDVGEYTSSHGHGAAAPTPCDPTAVAASEGGTPTPEGLDPSAVLCDHRGAAEDLALAATMAGQDHGRLYRFEVWEWGTVDMVDSRMGLLTINNLPKPAATAYWMLSHLRGERVAVINKLDGAHPYHLLAARDGDELTVVVAAQNRSVSDQFVRGLLTEGLVFAEDVAPAIADCPAFQSEDSEAAIAELASAGTTAEELVALCPDSLSVTLAEALAAALAYAAPRVGQVDAAFELAIDTEGEWSGPVNRYRIDAYRNTFAEAYRRWPDVPFATDSFDFAAAEEALWSYMTEALDEVEVVDGHLVIEVLPDSVTLLQGNISTR